MAFARKGQDEFQLVDHGICEPDARVLGVRL
jgi:hypothetical protein